MYVRCLRRNERAEKWKILGLILDFSVFGALVLLQMSATGAGRAVRGGSDCCCSQNLCFREVGTGSSATVYQLVGSDRIPLSLAMKVFTSDEKCRTEHEFLSVISHHNIVKVIGTPGCVRGKHFFLMEMMENGSLQFLYESQKLKEREIKLFMFQLLGAIEYLHAQNRVHGDIKCANCLVNGAKELKLGDFESAKELKDGQAKVNDIISKRWAAPEVFIDLRYGKEADIYSFGCTMLEAFCAGLPLPEQDVNRRNRSCRFPDIPPPPTVPLSARILIRRCLEEDKRKRPTAAELRKDEYFQEIEEERPQSVSSDPGSDSKGVLVFDIGSTPPFMDTSTTTLHEQCCLNKALAYRVQGGEPIDADDLYEQKEDFRGTSGGTRDHACDRECTFLKLI